MWTRQFRLRAWLLILCLCCFGLATRRATPAEPAPKAQPSEQEEFDRLLERLRHDNPGEFEKVRQLAERDHLSALRFLRTRFNPETDKTKPTDKIPPRTALKKGALTFTPLPARVERFTKVETLQVGEFTIDLCRRDDGAFGLGEVRREKLPLRRADFLIT